jgi:hypothetical protein
MKTTGVTLALVAALLSAPGGSPVSATESTRPPSKLKKVGDHWTPWDPPAAGPGAYIIEKGDTLWDLAAKWFKDPFLWPQIWDENRYILDSHWIYPGDPLVVPGRPTVVPPQGELPTPPIVEITPMPDKPAPTPVPAPPLPNPLVPMADATDLYCSGFIDPAAQPRDLTIVARDIERIGLAEGDVVFLSHGQDTGIHSGDELFITRRGGTVFHPSTGQPMGTLIRRLGQARVLIAHPTRSTALITTSCEDIREGDELMPRENIPVPMRTALPPFDRLDPTPSGGPTGYVVSTKDEVPEIGAGHIIYTDLGKANGLHPGDVLALYRERTEGLPRMNLGQAVVITVNDETSAARVVKSARESVVGDRVEVER